MADKDDKLAVARKRFAYALERDSGNRRLHVEDLKFVAGNSDNGYQWPDDVRRDRTSDVNGSRPCLTVNKLPQHINQVTNDGRQNRPAVKVLPVDDGADQDVAEVYNGIIRHIEASSDAEIAYDAALYTAVAASVGYIRVLTDYVDDESFDQDIKIAPVFDALNVVDDPDAKMPDGSDREFAFIYAELSKDDYEAQYPGKPVQWDLAASEDFAPFIVSEDKVRIAEYFSYEYDTKTLFELPDGSTSFDWPADLPKPADVRTRKVRIRKVKWQKINGVDVLDETEWAGRYIPLARVQGNVFFIEGKAERSGLTRNAKDAQRMYNYWSSQEVEMLALAPKAPFVATAEAIEGYEDQWKVANRANLSYLTYNAFDETGKPLPPPQRSMPPMPQQAIIQAKMAAADDMKSTTAQYNASLGQASNETSGRAIQARQREGDVATFHYIDNLSYAIKYIGKILVDLIPKIYDTQRVVRILGEDGEPDQAKLDPTAPQPKVEMKDGQGKAIETIYNLSTGRYDVRVTVGPSFTTKRQEAATNMIETVRAYPPLMQMAGDLIVKSQDWPGADELAKRLKKSLPPQLQDEEDEEIPPQVQAQMQQMQQQMQQLEGALQNASAEVDKLEAQQGDKSAEVEIRRIEANTKAYDAITKRLQILGPLLNPVEVQSLAAETKREAMEQPDPGQSPSESMGIPEQMPQMPQQVVEQGIPIQADPGLG